MLGTTAKSLAKRLEEVKPSRRHYYLGFWGEYQRENSENNNNKNNVKFRNKRTSGNHPNYSIIKIVQNNEKSPGDLWRLAVTQTPVRNHRLTLVWKSLKRVKITTTVLENKTHIILKDFEIHTNHLISARQPDLVRVSKKIEKINLKKKPNRGLFRSGRPLSVNKTERKER